MTPRRRRAADKKLNCVDLFAGAGGFSLGAIDAALNVVAAVELNSRAARTYKVNLSTKYGVTLYERDITALDPLEVVRAHFSSRTKKCDVVLGGPPCQGFSVHRINGAGVKDPRNELILRYFDYVHALRPKVFLMENVPGILWPRHKDFLDAFYEAASASGYRTLAPVIVDARDYGVPQRRKRVFILGIREDVQLSLTWPPRPTHHDPAIEPSRKRMKPWVPASTVFNKSIRKADPNNIHMNHSAELVEVFRATPKNGGSRHQSGRLLACHDGHSGHNDVYGRIDPEIAGPTMTTACINPSKGRFVHPTEHHGITVRHAARFQTFPDWFEFQGGLIAAGEQVGNAVPAKLAATLLREIKSALRKSSTKKTKSG
ncbi:DNA cytosine methyltransferase [Luteibacter sp. 9133]|uniref:DNA cytosine methyltransferase n=1 Tax=Luteibacter sp. 9133 TaxID=1500891 RepID=UPI0009DFAF82|nr:DNA cytosine methyltransferase [Luteibacter sp. 9133]